jgi:hypothetical protein
VFPITTQVLRSVSEKSIEEEVSEFEQRLGLRPNFYQDIVTNDDWSFIIKLNALFEAACTHALCQRLGCSELLEDLAQLEFADKRKGKIKFLRSLGAITEDQAKILYDLASLRNSLVHNVDQVAFSIDSYTASLDNNQLKAKCKLWGHGIADVLTDRGKKISRSEFVRAKPKEAIWLTCMEILACLHVEFELAEARAAQQAVRAYKEISKEIASGSALGVFLQGIPRQPGQK